MYNNNNNNNEEKGRTGKGMEKSIITGYHFVAPPLKTAGLDGKALAKSLKIEKKEVESSKGVAESLEVDTKLSWAPAKVVVGPLTPRVSFDQLYEIFSTFGEVVDIELRG